MFLFSKARRLIPLSIRSFAHELERNVEGFTFGNRDMPDKLYKTIELEMKSAEPQVMKSYETFITTAAKHLNITVGKIWFSKPNNMRWTLLRSVHIYRKHMVQYEVRTYYRWIQLHNMTGSTADTFLEYIERMLPEGVALKVTRLSLEPLPSHLCPRKIREALGYTNSEKSGKEKQNEQMESDRKSDSVVV